MSLLRAVATVGSYTLISRVTGFVRDILTAAYLGAGAAADAFLVAFQFPNLFRRLFAEGAFSAGFVPIFARLHQRDGAEKAQAFADAAYSMLALVLVAFCTAMMLAMPLVMLVVAPGFAKIPGQMDRAVELARIAFPYLLFVSLVSLQAGALNALHKFAAAAAAPIFLNLSLISFLLGAVVLESDVSRALAWGVPMAGVVQFLWLKYHCRRAGLPISFRRPRLTPEVKDLLGRMLPVAFGAGIYQLNLVINNIIATLVAVGAVSWLYYADRVNQLPLGVVGVAVGVALVPMLTRQIEAGNHDAALANQNRAIELCLLLTLPAAAGIGVLSEPIVATLFERGAFVAADRQAVGEALMAFSIGLPAYVLNKALTPNFYARHDTIMPVKISAAALVVSVGLSLLLIKPLGHVGIALATSISAWLNVGALTFVLASRGHVRADARLKTRMPRLLAAMTIMAVALFGGRIVSEAWFGQVFTEPGAGGLRAAILAALIALGAAVYFVAVIGLGAAERSDLKALRRSA
ncbi:MAG: murein biosynthesis integral membrane protein MurJ [Alphaproteobacteria bacterium]|nr:murein biosynthesis integral membrane protein MurJ [Alphaproteobacteria bacterium]